MAANPIRPCKDFRYDAPIMTSALPPLLDDEHAAFITGDGMSINAASLGENDVGNLARCVGCCLSPDRTRVVLLLAATPAAALLADVQRNGRIAAVFCEPLSHRAVQLKGIDARQEPFPQHELERVRRLCRTFAQSVFKYGEPIEVSMTMLHAPDDDLVAVSFTPLAAFSQTPGPRAGDPLKVSS